MSSPFHASITVIEIKIIYSQTLGTNKFYHFNLMLRNRKLEQSLERGFVSILYTVSDISSQMLPLKNRCLKCKLSKTLYLRKNIICKLQHIQYFFIQVLVR